jgi:hypothetical protein
MTFATIRSAAAATEARVSGWMTTTAVTTAQMPACAPNNG